MKNLLIFVARKNKFQNADQHKEAEILTKLQIDNSLAFGWKSEDIIIATNFSYEYNGIKTTVVSDETFSYKRRTTSKINAIIELIDRGIIGDELVWFHDLDAFQNTPVEELFIDDNKLALTHTSAGDPRLSTGVMFFRAGARDIFELIQQECRKSLVNEERALYTLNSKIRDRLIILNLSYNFAIRKRNLILNYAVSDKPIRVLHFHPKDKRPCTDTPKSSLEVVYGDNSFKERLVGEILDKSFQKHNIK